MDPTESAYAELRLAYDTFNARLFENSLPSCLLTLQREKRTYGYFSSKRFGNREGATTDEIALNPEYFAVVPVIETLQTVVHEMTHLWQAHFGKPGRGRYHNAEWAEKMESIGLMPSNTGRPGGRRVGDCMADYAIDGGPFARVVSELLKNHKFAISWYDRFTPPRPLYPVALATELPSVPSAALEVPADLGVAVTPRLPTPAAPNRSNRLKYTCSTCGLSVWGKPALRVACMSCSIELEPEDSAVAGTPIEIAGRTVARRGTPRSKHRPGASHP